MHVLQVKDGIVSALDNLIPEDDLVQFIVLGLVLGSQVQEQLFHVPVEQGVQVSIEIECDVAQVPLLPVGAVIRDILPGRENTFQDAGLEGDLRGTWVVFAESWYEEVSYSHYSTRCTNRDRCLVVQEDGGQKTAECQEG